MAAARPTAMIVAFMVLTLSPSTARPAPTDEDADRERWS
jgi:hypothetical protein